MTRCGASGKVLFCSKHSVFVRSFVLSFLPLWVGDPISLLYHISVPSSQRALGTLVFEQIGFITHTSWESVGVSQLDAVWKTYWRIWACFRYFGGSLKEVGLCSGLNAVRKWIWYHRYFDKSYFSRRREAKASHFSVSTQAAVSHRARPHLGEVWSFFGLDSVPAPGGVQMQWRSGRAARVRHGDRKPPLTWASVWNCWVGAVRVRPAPTAETAFLLVMLPAWVEKAIFLPSCHVCIF